MCSHNTRQDYYYCCRYINVTCNVSEITSDIFMYINPTISCILYIYQTYIKSNICFTIMEHMEYIYVFKMQYVAIALRESLSLLPVLNKMSSLRRRVYTINFMINVMYFSYKYIHSTSVHFSTHI